LYGALLGVGLVAVFIVVLVPFRDQTTSATAALALVVPVVIAA